MKKIYMILAAMALLSMSLNAQLLPGKKGNPNLAPKGTATLATHNSQFRMPALSSNEYLVGPYVTDDFEATGLSFYNFYPKGQNVTPVVDLPRSEWEDHLGDTIIGFRFALAGSNNIKVYDFGMYPGSDSYWATTASTIWKVGGLDYSGGGTGGYSPVYQYQRITSTSDLTSGGEYLIVYETDNVAFNGTLAPPDAGNNVISVNRNNTVIESNATTDAATFTITANGNYYTIRSSSGYYIGRTSNNNGMQYSTTTLYNNSITFNGNNVVIRGRSGTGNNATNTYYLRFNSSSGANNYRFRYYDQNSQRPIQLYKKVEVSSSGSSSSTVTVGNGATYNTYLPVYGWYNDYGYQNQMIYSASQLGLSTGSQITSLTFYPREGWGINFAGGTVVVKLATTNVNNFGTSSGTVNKLTASDLTSSLTTVATVTPVNNANATEWVINFTTPFTYNGGNLMVQLDHEGGDYSYPESYFMGDNQSTYVSLYNGSRTALTNTTGTNSQFLPKATFGYIGSSSGGNDYDYLTLTGGQWYDFFLDEPIEFSMHDSIASIAIGYTYYQEYNSSYAPVAYNSNSTGHYHYVNMYSLNSNTNSYQKIFWVLGETPATYMPGDLAVQLIFKSSLEKTDPPTITYTSDGAYYYITATAPTSDPNAEVTLTVGGQTVTGTGSVMIPVGRGETDQTVTATATAQADGKAVSDPTTQTITIEASPLDPTPTPSISSQVLDASVEVIGSGQGDVHLYIDGVEVSNPAYVERTDEQYTVTVTVTAQITDGEHSMSSYTTTVVIPPISFDPDAEGWTQLPGLYNNDEVIAWSHYLMFVDRFKESTAQNNHPLQYVYKMTENEGKLTERRTTNEHTIPVQHTGSKVFGYYTEEDVLADRDRLHVDTCVMNAEVQMNLEQNTQIYYYTLDRSRSSIQDDNFLELSYLQNDGARYVEMDNFYTLHEPFQFGTMQRFDTINTVLPATAPQGEDGKHYGKYGVDYMAYVPIVWTHGNDPANTRLNYENDGLNNSYGSPIWRTSVGKVELVSAQLERQKGKNGTANWEIVNGTDTIPCSLYMIKSLTANGFLPDPSKSNIKYEPYMFRVWITSPTGKLRKYKVQSTENWANYVDDGPIAANTPYWLWDEAIADESDYIQPTDQFTTQFHFWKQEDWEHLTDNENDSTWVLPEDVNMIFAAPDDLSADDVKIIVRFYYKSTGNALNQQQNGLFLMGNRDGENGFYGVEEPGGDPDPEIPTYIRSIYVIPQSHGEVVGVTYYNLSGAQSSTPFDGINIVVTRYSDGTTTSQKVVRMR